MAFREKTAWISLVSFVAVYGAYFWSVVQTAAAGRERDFGFSSQLISTVILLIIIQIVLNAIAAVRDPKDAQAPMDERERLFDLKATDIGYTVLASGVVIAFLLVGFGFTPFVMGNGLFFVLVFAEIVRTTAKIAYYRRSA
jgi:hypothetical protein